MNQDKDEKISGLRVGGIFFSTCSISNHIASTSIGILSGEAI